MDNCLKCEYHYILDKMVMGFYEIRCRHDRMRDYQVLACFDEEQIAKIKDNMIRINPPKQCPSLNIIRPGILAFAEAMEKMIMECPKDYIPKGYYYLLEADDE